ncbi:MAG: DNA polymerase III subunit gamma/tau, partial [Phycisphaerae bacterium]|nr:DNA polymerase III subunit gamma/tau [Phycisphaerae bacterium]
DGASNRGIEEIRELRANAIFRPSRCRYKVYYIDEVHMLTREAFNALLKTLEEPPEHVKFIFSTTETEKVPATILSRCQRFDFRNIPTRAIAAHLRTLCDAEKVQAADDALFRVARAASGSMRDGLSLLDQLMSASGQVTDDGVIRILGTPSDERMNDIVTAIADGNSAAALGALAGVLASGVTLNSIVTALGGVYRNMMLASTCGSDSDLIELPEMQLKAVSELAGRFSTPVLVHGLGLLQAAGRNIRGSSIARGLVEATLVRLAEAEKFINPESIVERIEQLSPSGPDAGQKKKHL